MMVFFVIAGCETTSEPPPRATELEPKPQRPTHTISVNIDSIPSGADCYAIEEDGQLGAKIGTTPFVHEIGVADRYRLYTDTKERTSFEHFLEGDSTEHFVWGDGAHWERELTESGAIVIGSSMLVLKIALAKGDHSIAVASKKLRSSSVEAENKAISLTVPLKTVEQVNREVELYLRQQALADARNRNVQSSDKNQNITITQKKDELDSINSALDALIKMNALGAFDR